MKTQTSLMAGASRFAHFAGLTRPNAQRAAEDDQNDKEKDGKGSGRADEGDGDDDKDKSGKRSGRADEGDDKEKDGKRSGRADEGDGDDDKDKSGKRSGRADESDGDDDKDKSGKRSGRAAEGDDDEDEDDDKDEMSGSSKAATARQRERARCAAIFGHKAAASNVALAASLAFDTTMTRQEAIAVLRGQAGRGDEDRGGNRPRREARPSREQHNAHLGSDTAEPSGKAAVTASWDRAFAKAGVKLG